MEKRETSGYIRDDFYDERIVSPKGEEKEEREESCFDPSNMTFKYIILGLNCLSILGGCYSDVAIAVISTDLMKVMNYDFNFRFSNRIS